MEHEIKILESMTNDERSKVALGKIAAELNALSETCLESLKASKEANALSENFREQLVVTTKANLDLVSVLKNIETVLLSRKELWKKDKEVKELVDAIAVFILSSSSIKAGLLVE